MKKKLINFDPRDLQLDGFINSTTEASDINKLIKKWGRNNICPKHKVKFKKCCIPVIQKYGHISEKTLRFTKLVSELQSEFDLETSFTTLYKSFGYANKIRNSFLLNSEWGSINLKINPVVDCERTFENLNKLTSNYNEIEPIDYHQDIIELEEIYIMKKYRYSGMGTKWLNGLKSLCDKYGFSLYVIAGSIGYSKQVINSFKENSLLQSKRVNSDVEMTNNKRRALMFGMNLNWWKNLYNMSSEVVKTYEESVSKEMEKVNPLTDLVSSTNRKEDRKNYNDLQVKDSRKVSEWYRSNGFVTTTRPLTDWLILVHHRRLTNTNITYTGETHMICYHPKHLERMKKYRFLNLSNGRIDVSESYDYESTIKYIQFILTNNRTDLPYKDIVRELVFKEAS